ncbi:hypothetical protein PR048_013897 [Dryococelus australis]|uniref:Fatty acid synthase pseudo-KR domain-containing protein n=1 Tax=Dryococelus australis TaxID=614101 RepID=A0ABQ9HUC3_9NEOP|nr:hypothetical protein PR048_013897 [Dryococelus australis]
MKNGGFIPYFEDQSTDSHQVLHTLSATLEYCNKIIFFQVPETPDYIVIPVDSDSFDWVPVVQKAMKELSSNQRIILVSERNPLSGLAGFVNCIRKEPGGEAIRGVLVMDPEAPPFSLNDPLYAEELAKDMAMNVYKDGEWGTYRHLLMDSLPLVTCPHASINVSTQGDLSSLKWFQRQLDEHGSVKRRLLSLAAAIRVPFPTFTCGNHGGGISLSILVALYHTFHRRLIVGSHSPSHFRDDENLWVVGVNSTQNATSECELFSHMSSSGNTIT